jgi:alpha-tubulin suppressor-like RCC1 family protein
LVPCLEDGSGYDQNNGVDCGFRNSCDQDNQQCTTTECSRMNVHQCSASGVLQSCGPGGFWEDVDNCGSQARCDDGYSFCQVCEPWASYCSGQYLLQCNSLGTAFVQARDCGPGAGSCLDNGNFDYCSTGCDGVNTYDICNESRQLVHCNPGGDSADSCTVACSDGGSVPACVSCFPGEHRCSNNNELEKCNAAGSGWAVEDDCNTGSRSCSDRVGACLNAPPGSYYCKDDTQEVMKVQADGSEYMYDQCHPNEHCDVSRGGCILTRCAANELLCDGDGLVQCNEYGDDWSDVERCANGSMCLNGLGCLEPAVIAAGEAHTCIIAVPSGMPPGTQGVAICWGAGDKGQLGTGAPVMADTSSPRRVVFNIGELEFGVDHFLFPAFTDVCAGRDFSCAKFVDMEGGTEELIACWGSNALGQLGIDNDSAGPFDHITEAVTDGIGNGTDPEIVGLGQMTCGASFACALHNNGTAYCWGANNHGQLGVGSDEPLLRLATPIEGHDFVQLSAGAQHVCGIKADNSVWCWGAGARGRLGNDAEDDSNVPIEVGDLAAKKTLLPMLGADFNVLISNAAAVNSWGGNVLGQLGTGNTMGSLVPVEVMDLNAPDLSGLSLGAMAQHACAIQDGVLSCWGSNALGQLGTGNKLDRTVPTVTAMDGSMPELTIADLPKAVAVGGAHTCVIASDKQVYCWGHNGRGQLGNALAENPQLSPIAVDFP